MTRTEAIAILTATLPALTDAQLFEILEEARLRAAPSVYSTLSDEHRARIDSALDRLDQGRSVPSQTVFASLAAKLKAAGA